MASAFSVEQLHADIEFSLIGTLLKESNRIDAVADILSPDDFAEPIIGHIYSVVIAEHAKGHAINPLTLRPLISGLPQYQELGGDRLIAQLGVTAPYPPVPMAQTIVRAARRRRLRQGLIDSVAMADAAEPTVEEVIDAADAAIVDASGFQTNVVQMTAAKAVSNLANSLEQPKRGVVSKIIGSLDDLMGPLRPKQLCIMAGRPGMGKSAVASSYALGVAQGGVGVLFVSLEMGAEELAERMVADLSFNGATGLPMSRITGSTSRETFRAIQSAHDMLDDMPIDILDAGSLTVGRLAMIVRRHKRRLAAKGIELGLVVVDYLQLLRTDGAHRSNYESVSEISRSLKAIAKDNDVAVMALAQLSREVERRNGKVPQLADLRDSGQIEQDADAVLFLLREEYYLLQEEPDQTDPTRKDWEILMGDARGKIDFILAKRRAGRTGRAMGQFHVEYQAVRG